MNEELRLHAMASIGKNSGWYVWDVKCLIKGSTCNKLEVKLFQYMWARTRVQSTPKPCRPVIWNSIQFKTTWQNIRLHKLNEILMNPLLGTPPTSVPQSRPVHKAIMPSSFSKQAKFQKTKIKSYGQNVKICLVIYKWSKQTNFRHLASKAIHERWHHMHRWLKALTRPILSFSSVS